MRTSFARSRVSRIAVLAALGTLLWAGSASATTANCIDAPDGTACSTECLVGGVCARGVCVNGVVRPDGTQCASGDQCTQNDACKSGQCVAGGPIDCMPGPCETAVCVKGAGCVYTPTCDMGGPPDLASYDLASAFDLASNVRDLASLQDLATDQDAGAPPDLIAATTDGGRLDLAEPPDLLAVDLPMSMDDLAPEADLRPVDDLDGGTSDDADLQGKALGDAGTTDDADVGLHVHGSGCSISGRGDVSGPALALAFALLLRRRRAPPR